MHYMSNISIQDVKDPLLLNNLHQCYISQGTDRLFLERQFFLNRAYSILDFSYCL